MNLAAIPTLLPGVRKHVKAYRMVNKEYATSIDEIGISLLNGWRYNPKGEFGVLYFSLNTDCCLKEKIKQAGSRDSLRPQVVGNFDIRIEHCLDLTNDKVLGKIEIDRFRLVTPSDFTETQAIARDTRRAGFEAMLVPSAVGLECTNLVVFKDKLGRKSHCELKEVNNHKI